MPKILHLSARTPHQLSIYVYNYYQYYYYQAFCSFVTLMFLLCKLQACGTWEQHYHQNIT